MEYMGHTQTATYMTAPPTRTPTFLPDIVDHTYQTHRIIDTYPAPSPLRRSITSLPWRPSVYYYTAKNNPTTFLTRSATEPFSKRNFLTQLDPNKVPTVFPSARTALYTRYSPSQWHTSNQSNFATSDRIRTAGEKLRMDAVRLCREADDVTGHQQGEAGKRLGERVDDIRFWENELNHETDLLVEEKEKQEVTKRALEKVLHESQNPLAIAQECLFEREKRQGIELVHDAPEQSLINEVDSIKQCQERLRNMLDRSNVQLNLMRSAQHELEKDRDNKHTAKNIDTTCHWMRNASTGINFHSGIERIDNTLSVPETWAKFTGDNIHRSQSERLSSNQLRDASKQEIANVIAQMQNHWDNVNTELSRRLQESTEARNRIQAHLAKVIQEIFDMERHIDLLKKTIHDKEQPLQVAQTRLRTRTHRPDIEACRDPAMHTLVEEVHQLYQTVEQLNQKLREAENTLQNLLQTKTALEHDLALKNNAIFIEQEKCLAIRKAFPMTPNHAIKIP